MILCNQGCGTHIYFKDKRPYNILDKKRHDCPMLHMAKLWGGRYNTIPMGRIFTMIIMSYDDCYAANNSRNIDDILKTLNTTVRRLTDVISQMKKQEEQNTEWSNELETYKDNLVKEQRRREEQKEKEKKEKDKDEVPKFQRANELVDE